MLYICFYLHHILPLLLYGGTYSKVFDVICLLLSSDCSISLLYISVFCVGLCPVSFCLSSICVQAAAALSNIHDQQWEVLYQQRVWTWQSRDFPLFLGPQRQDDPQQNISTSGKAPAFVCTKLMQPMHLHPPLLLLARFILAVSPPFGIKGFSFPFLSIPTYSEVKSVVWQQYSWVHISPKSKVSLMSTYVNPPLLKVPCRCVLPPPPHLRLAVPLHRAPVVRSVEHSKPWLAGPSVRGSGPLLPPRGCTRGGKGRVRATTFDSSTHWVCWWPGGHRRG